MKETAVEWFSDKIWELEEQISNKEITIGQYAVNRVKLVEQAKEKEKEQMVDATVQYLIKHRGAYSELAISQAVALSEQYYNEKYQNK